MNATLRIRRSYFWVGLVCTLFFAAIAVLNVLAMYLAAPAERRATALAVGLAIGGFWLVMMGLGVWILLAYWRHCLAIRDDQIDYIGVTHRKRMRVPEIRHARWRCWPAAGSLVLKTSSTRLALDFGDYELEERRQLIRFFRESVPSPLQHGWELFYARIVKRRTRRPRETELRDGEVLLTRRRLDSYFLAGFTLIGMVSVYVCWSTGQFPFLAFPLAMIPIWLLVHFKTPREGLVSRRLTADARGWFCGLASVCTFGGMGCWALLNAFSPRAAAAFEIAFMTVLLAGLFTGVAILDRRRRREERAAVEEVRQRGELIPPELLEPWDRRILNGSDSA